MSKNRSLGTKIFLASVAGLVLSMFCAMAAFLWFSGNESYAEFRKDLETAQYSSLKVAELQSARLKAALDSIRHSPRFVSAIQVGIHDMPTLKDLSQTEYTLLADAEFFSIFSDSGDLLVSLLGDAGFSDYTEKEKEHLTGHDLVQVHLSDHSYEKLKHKVSKSGVFEDYLILRDRLFRVLSCPIYDNHDNLIAVLTVGDEVNSVMAEELARFTGCEISYSGSEGLFATSLDNHSDLVETHGDIPEHVSTFLQWGEYLILAHPLEHGLEDRPIFLVVKRSMKSFLKNRQHVMLLSCLLLAILLGVSFLMNLWLSGKIVRPIKVLTEAMTRVGQGDLTVQVHIDSGDEVQTLADTFSDMVVGLRERQNMSRYLTGMELQEVKSAVESNQMVQRGGTKKIVSVLFSDIRSFTTLCESSDPGLIVDSLNYYYNQVIPLIEKNHGSLDKLIGDCVMAVFEESDGQNCADNALTAAVEMSKKLAEITPSMQEAGLLSFCVGYGISTGVAVVGNVGTEEQMSRTVLGDTVNLAARVESYSKDGKHTCILYSEATRIALRKKWEDELLTEVTVKGKSVPIKIYELTQV
ncbi:MAG: adenylate/guanylate cyclase domain-containing protein [Candidatus Cloacimonetes bacterium]|nr:adenylate/guanylate cyclase domain-containing protein [Candidatus Cloacimonadota bacterium]